MCVQIFSQLSVMSPEARCSVPAAISGLLKGF
jgi:hypothetical protein